MFSFQACEATAWHRGHFEEDVNAAVLDEASDIEWNGGEPACDHNEVEILDEEFE